MRVVIAGGGTSAWMTASALCKTYPEWDIRIITGGPANGVGESTTPHINQYLDYMGIDDKTFLKEAKATYKISSRFEDFSDKGEVFHYPNGQTLRTDLTWHQWMSAREYTMMLPSFAEVFQPAVTIAEAGKLPLSHKLLHSYDLSRDRSFHIDGKAFSEFLQRTYCKTIKVVDSKIKSVSYRGYNVQYVVVGSNNFTFRGEKVYADLYIDCTGQQAVISGKQSDWIPFDTILTDTALVKKIDYSITRAEMVPYTNAKGMSAGWEWTIPTWDYISKGYVFSSKYQGLEDAFLEFAQEEPRIIQFQNGRHERGWTANVVSIGLSYGFIEPLESTSLFNTGHGILSLMDILDEGPSPGQFARDRFNFNMSEHMDGWREFVEAHYYYSKRRDTPFWRAVTDEVEYDMTGAHQTIMQAMITGEEIPHGLDPIVYILAGSGYSNVNSRLDQYFGTAPVADEFSAQHWALQHQTVKCLSDEMPTQHSYLDKTVWT